MRVFEVLVTADMRGTFRVDFTVWSKGLSVEVGGHGVVSHVGSGLLRMVADRVGLTGELSKALARRDFAPRHDRGRVLTDLAVAIADGATTISEIDTLRHQVDLFGRWLPTPRCGGCWMRPAGSGWAGSPRRGPGRAGRSGGMCRLVTVRSRRPGSPGGIWAR